MSKRIDLHRSVDLGRRNCIKERRGGEKKKRAGCVIRVCTFSEIFALMVLQLLFQEFNQDSDGEVLVYMSKDAVFWYNLDSDKI